MEKFIYYAWLLDQLFPMPKEIIILIVTFINKCLRPKIYCGYGNSAVLYDNKLYLWGSYELLPVTFGKSQYFPKRFDSYPTEFRRKHDPLDFDPKNTTLVTFTTNHIIILFKNNWTFINNRIFYYNDYKFERGTPQIRKILSRGIVVSRCGKVFYWDRHIGTSKLSLTYLNLNNVKTIGIRERSVDAWADILGYDGRVNTYKIIDDTLIFCKEQSVLNIIKLASGREHTAVVDNNGNAYEWGMLGEEETKPYSWSIPDAISVSCGSHFTIVLTKHNKIFGSGSNELGQLGLYNKTNTIWPPIKLTIDNVISVKCGFVHTMVLTAMNKIYVFGANGEGQLGLGSKIGIIVNSPQLLKYPFEESV